MPKSQGKTTNSASSAQPKLKVQREDAANQIGSQIEKGRELEQKVISSKQELDEWMRTKSKWYDFSRHLLLTLFDSEVLADEFQWASRHTTTNKNLQAQTNDRKHALALQLAKLESIRDRLCLIDDARTTPLKADGLDSVIDLKRDVFLVHGRNEGVRERVARFLERLDLKPIILHEQPNQGRTIIEKFEDYSGVAFAVVLLTGDDHGGLKGEPFENQKLRARQNVILELGFFLGLLSRSRVCALYEHGVEIPSDYQGVAFVELDDRERWHVELAKEMKAAGLPVDMNKL